MAEKKYTDEQRTEALAVYLASGPAEAERQTGIPRKTIASWAARAGVQTDAPSRTAAATEAARQRWAQRRAQMADDIGRVSAVLLEAAERAAESGDGRQAQALMTGVAIGVDKAELLTGRATSRSESLQADPAARAAEAAELRDAVAEGRQQMRVVS